MPTSIPSIRTFTHPGVVAPFDVDAQPTQATAFWLTRDIIRGVFPPLERLKIEQLSQFYEVSFSTVREAILFLSATHLVVHEPQRGYHVAPVSLRDFEDVIDVYRRIYKMSALIAVDRGDEAWEEEVVLRTHRSQKVPKVMPEGDPEGRELWQRTYSGFHRTLLSGCESDVLLDYFDDLRGRLERYVTLFGDLESDRERNQHAEHKKIVDALVARDPAQLSQLIDEYLEKAEPIRQSIVEALARQDNQGGGPPATRGTLSQRHPRRPTRVAAKRKPAP